MNRLAAKKDEEDQPEPHPQNADVGLTVQAPVDSEFWRPRRASHEPASAYENPRPPALPAGVIRTLEEYYTAAALMGVIAAQGEAPELDGLTNWAIAAGEMAARKVKAKRW